MATSRATFSYERLRDTTDEIRLLKVQAQPGSSECLNVECELSTWQLARCPKYVATSYTWGDAKDEKAISLNGKLFCVRQNCYSLLQQVMHHGIEHYIWVDSVCINQGDNEEKSAQVAMMGEIYKTAELVYAFLGQHENNSSLLFRLARRFASHADCLLKKAKETGILPCVPRDLAGSGKLDAWMARPTDDVNMAEFSPVTRAMLVYELGVGRMFRGMSVPELKAALWALYDFSERPYFSRLWIVQEVILGRDVVLLCGDSFLHFADFADFVEGLESYCREQKIQDIAGITSDNLSYLLGVFHSWTAVGKSLLELTDSFSGFKCYDPRDRIFGMSALVNWGDYERYRPDYNQDVMSVALQTMSYMCPLIVQTEEADASPYGTDVEHDTFNDRWPIVSATHVATALGLHSGNERIAAMVRTRRGEQHVQNDPILYRRPPGVGSAIPVPVDGHCELFASTQLDADFEACLSCNDNWDALLEEGTPPGFERQPPRMAERPTGRTVYGNAKLCAHVPEEAEIGDLILSFHVSGGNFGLVARETTDQENQYRIIGQVVFGHSARPCSGGPSCACSFGPHMHAGEAEQLTVFFDPEDLLLFICQSLSESGHKTLDLGRWQEYEAAEKVSESLFIQEDEIIEDEELQAFRLSTSITKPDNDMSTFARLTMKTDKSARRVSLSTLRESMQL